MRPSVLAPVPSFTPARLVAVVGRLVLVALGVLAGVAVSHGVAQAREPALERWTPLTAEVKPEHIVNYTTIPADEAAGMLASQQAPLLYEADSDFDLLPEEGVVLRSRHRMIVDNGYGLFPGEQGWSLWRLDGKRAREPMHEVSNRVRRVLGMPVTDRTTWKQLGPYEPLLVELDDRLVLVMHVEAKVVDPYDPSRSTLWASLAASSTIPLVTVIEGERDTWRILLTLGGRHRDEPRVVFLPVDPEGALDPSRDGVLIRFGVVQSRLDPTMRTIVGAVHPSAVRIHFGDRDSLEQRLDAMPPPTRERYAQPGSATDPLMIAPRTPRDPLGAGVEVRSAMLGELTLLALRGAPPSNVVPRWGGIEVDGWVGRGWMGAVVRDDLVVGQAGFRVGNMRDTGATAMGLELGAHLGSDFSTTYTPLAVNVVLSSVRMSTQRLFGQQVEMSNTFRVGTVGFEYRSDIGLRSYVGKGLVVTPHATGAFRYAVREERALLLLGGGVEVTLNRNWFRH